MNDDNIIVRCIDMPYCVKGVTIPHSDGTYNIFINARYSADMQKQIYKHELCHLHSNDFDNFEKINECEKRAKNSELIAAGLT